jgi:hypothetical protein
MSFVRYGQSIPPFGSSSCQYFTAIFCAHSGSETMLVGSSSFGGLIGTLHILAVLSI